MNGIVVIDTGFGGLPVVHEVMLALPDAGIDYIVVDSTDRATEAGLPLDALSVLIEQLVPEAVLVSSDELCARGVAIALRAGLAGRVTELPEHKLAHAWAAGNRRPGIVASESARALALYQRYAASLPEPVEVSLAGSRKLDALLATREVWHDDLNRAIKLAVNELLDQDVEVVILGTSAELARSSFRRYAGDQRLQSRSVIASALRGFRPERRLGMKLRFHLTVPNAQFAERAAQILQLPIRSEHMTSWS